MKGLIIFLLVLLLDPSFGAVFLSSESCDLPGSPDEMFILFHEEAEKRDFSTANETCSEEGGMLAKVANFEEFNYLVDFILRNLPEVQIDTVNGVQIENNKVLRGSIWLGIKDFDGTSPAGSTSTDRFSFLDGSPPSFFNGTPSVEPWIPNDPTNTNGNEDCVMAVQNNLGNIGLADVICTPTRRFLCRVPCNITASPSATPTFAPTSAPTESQNCRETNLGIKRPLTTSQANL